MTPEAKLVHALGGRARLHVRSMRGLVAYFERVENELRQLEGVKSVRTHPLTTSIVVEFEGALEALLERAERAGLFRVTAKLAEDAHVLRRMLERYAQGDENMWHYTQGRLDFATLGFFGLAFAGIYQIARGNALPPGVTLLRYAFEVLISAGKPEARKGREQVH